VNSCPDLSGTGELKTVKKQPSTGNLHHPIEVDHGVITPTAALSSFPYTPVESMKVLRNLFENYEDKTLGPYGFSMLSALNTTGTPSDTWLLTRGRLWL
jgi:hypothetical protein